MSQPTPTPIPSFDQVVKGNVDIKKLSKNNYQIKISEISKFLKYQTWSDSSKTLNENRKVFYQNAKHWVQYFNSLNASLKASDKPLFTPTTVMEIGLKKYLFVIDEAKLNGKGHVVFKVSTKEIKLSDKKMLKLPCGHHDGVRFDIDTLPPSALPASAYTLLKKPVEWIIYTDDVTSWYVVALNGSNAPYLFQSSEITSLVTNPMDLSTGYIINGNGFSTFFTQL